jgi:hypothetical protein
VAVDQSAVIPTTLPAAVRAQLRRAFTPPYEAPFVVVANGVLMGLAWFLLPPEWLFHVHTARVFPITLAAWMLADVPATNVLGSDPVRTSLVLDRPRELRRLLTAKHLTLWLLVAPICSVVAVVVGVGSGERPLGVASTVAALVIVPFGALGIASWLGILWPYHVLSLDQRWRGRRPYGRMIVRWLTLAIVPYMLVPFLAGAIVAPVLLVWRRHGLTLTSADDRGFAALVLVLAVVSALAWLVGQAVATRLAANRATALRSYLADPSLG